MIIISTFFSSFVTCFFCCFLVVLHFFGCLWLNVKCNVYYLVGMCFDLLCV